MFHYTGQSGDRQECIQGQRGKCKWQTSNMLVDKEADLNMAERSTTWCSECVGDPCLKSETDARHLKVFALCSVMNMTLTQEGQGTISISEADTCNQHANENTSILTPTCVLYKYLYPFSHSPESLCYFIFLDFIQINLKNQYITDLGL